MYQIAEVVIDKATITFDKKYSYFIPQNSGFNIKPGCRVTVPFGGYNKRRTALCTAIYKSNERENLKPISTQVDEEPILNKEALEIMEFLKKYTFCTYFDAVKVLIPSGVGLKIDNKLVLLIKPPYDQNFSEKALDIINFLLEYNKPISKKELCKSLSIVEHDEDLLQLIQKGIISESTADKAKIQNEKALMVKLINDDVIKKPLTEKQKLVKDFLEKVNTASVKEICYYTGVSKQIITTFVKHGYGEYFEQEVYRSPYGNEYYKKDEITLNDKQNFAFDKLKLLCQNNKPETALLYGVTGSGKTSVFMKLIEYVTEQQNKNVIVMVPEISLTPQTMDKFFRCFGEKIAILHSGLTMSQRRDQWKKIRDKKAKIVVGTRSAVFAPLENIGLIVIDEEHEHTYKSEISPRFHAKDVASFRCKYHNALLLLSSATPCIESYYNAQNNKYTLVTLTERFKNAVLPDVYVVDMKNSIMESSTSGISQTVMEELYINLKNHEQSILLLNRRGYNTMIKCSSCGETIKCPNCSVPLHFHSSNNKLMCHYCGYSSKIMDECPTCHNKMIRYTGVGTQRAEEFLKESFPDAKILRMDMDTTMNLESYEKNFADFAEGKYDIMIGTQMVAKGLNFPNVTLVGVLTADQALFSQSFRGCERAFSLITQVVGRGGRGNLPGRAYIQTSTPDNQIIQLASKQNYEDFYKEEILFRKINLYPPFCKITCLIFSSDFENDVPEAAKFCGKLIGNLAETKYPKLPIKTLAPVEADVYKIAGKFHYNMLIKHSQQKDFYSLMETVQEEFLKNKKYNRVNLYIDTNYDG